MSAAAEQLLSAPADDRILIVVSDGMPAGRRSTDQDLRNVVRLLAREPRLRLIGVGIGNDSIPREPQRRT